ncbi:MAG: serine acetyltransferase [Bacteroidia bacterium]|nr:serine acetyltransferase [Bacteroidia bacterium]
MNTDYSMLNKVVNELCDVNTYGFLYHDSKHDIPMPSTDDLAEIMETLKKILFPGYFGNSERHRETVKYYIGAYLDIVNNLLAEQVKRGFCFSCTDKYPDCSDCEQAAKETTMQFISRLPKIKNLLATDVVAAFNGDPAAKNYGETIFCYPSITAVTHYRIAHELLVLGVPLIPRIITEMSHSKTGIDIHPGAEIGEYFFIDHGTGVVIGETCIIGKNVRIYQGVTLGAKSFPLDENGKPIKGIPRHPVVEDDVIIYSNATALGRITIGRGSVVGGNMWITQDVPADTKVLQKKAPDHSSSEVFFL